MSISPRHINKQIRRNVRSTARPQERASAAIIALKTELNRRVQVLEELSAEEEKCHRETMAWMADLNAGDLPEGPGAMRSDPYTFENFSQVVESIENEDARERGTATTLTDLARSGDFASLVDAVAAYKTACFGGDAVAANSSSVREMILRSNEPDVEILHEAKVVEENREETLEKELDIERDRKLNLCRFYGLETLSISGPLQAPDPSVSPASANNPPQNKARQTNFNEFERWTLANAHHPYPSTTEKARLSDLLNLSVGQVQHWFSNMRKRKYFPVVDGRRAPRDDFEVELLAEYKRNPPSFAHTSSSGGDGDEGDVVMVDPTLTPPNTTAIPTAVFDGGSGEGVSSPSPNLSASSAATVFRAPPTSSSAGGAPPLASLPEEDADLLLSEEVGV